MWGASLVLVLHFRNVSMTGKVDRLLQILEWKYEPNALVDCSVINLTQNKCHLLVFNITESSINKPGNTFLSSQSIMLHLPPSPETQKSGTQLPCNFCYDRK